MSERETWSAEVTMPDGSRKTVGLNEDGELSLGGGTLPEGTSLPEGLKGLFLDGGTLPPGTALPEGLEWLSLGGGTLSPGTVLPEGLELLFLDGGTLPEGTALPEGLKRISLGGGALPEGTGLPEGLEFLYLGGGTLPPGTQLPEGLWTLYLGGGTLPAGTAIPEGCEVQGVGPDGIYGPCVSYLAADPEIEPSVRITLSHGLAWFEDGTSAPASVEMIRAAPKLMETLEWMARILERGPVPTADSAASMAKKAFSVIAEATQTEKRGVRV